MTSSLVTADRSRSGHDLYVHAAGMLQGMGCALCVASLRNNQADAARQAWRLAALRWHPDKFMALYGDLVPAAQRAVVCGRLAAVWQQLQLERQTMQL